MVIESALEIKLLMFGIISFFIDCPTISSFPPSMFKYSKYSSYSTLKPLVSVTQSFVFGLFGKT